MAPRPSRRRRDADESSKRSDAEDDVDLGAAEHAWWAQRDIDEPWAPHARRDPPPQDEPERDVLAEHFGADWRTSFGFDDPAPEPAAPAEPPEASRSTADSEPEPPMPDDTSDPYAVLGVAASAPWEDIVAAHRSRARRYHPDRAASRGPDDAEAAEEIIRVINAAYKELKVRRGR